MIRCPIIFFAAAVELQDNGRVNSAASPKNTSRQRTQHHHRKLRILTVAANHGGVATAQAMDLTLVTSDDSWSGFLAMILARFLNLVAKKRFPQQLPLPHQDPAALHHQLLVLQRGNKKHSALVVCRPSALGLALPCLECALRMISPSTAYHGR